MKCIHISKYSQYLFKQLLICFGVLSIGFISLWYYSNLEGALISILYGVTIDIVIAFIPAAIAFSSIRKNFKKELIDIYSLKEKLKYLRFEIKDLILGMGLKQIHLILNPSIINKIRDLLRKFDFFHEASILNAFIEQKLLYQVDILLIEVIKLTKSYDNGKQWKKLQNECEEALSQLKEVRDFSIPNEKLKNKFIENLDWILAYELFFKKENKYSAIVYYGPL